jgi:phage terminase large subunit
MPAAIEEIGRLVRCVAGDNDVAGGIGRVKSLLKQKRLFIDRSCVNLIRELESYHYEKEGRGQEFCETPAKRDDHAVDSLRYCLFQKEMGTGDFYIG